MSINTRIWLVGKSSRLGSALDSILSKQMYQIISTDIDDVDITDLKQVEHYIDQNRPDIVINCAAKSDRLWCEENPEEAFRLHAIGARNLAIASHASGAHLFYLSSDFVFEGNSTIPYTEFDKPNPQTVYGKSKLAGEEFVRNHCTNHTILRSSWMYGKKFLNQIIKEARDTGQVKVHQNIIGSPTSSLEIVKMILKFIDSNEFGTFHISCEGEASQREFASEILRIANIDAILVDSDSQGYFEAFRPRYSVLDNLMLRLTRKESMDDWKISLERFMKERKVGVNAK